MWASESGRLELKMVPSLPLLSWESSVSLNKTLFRSSHMVVLYRQVLCIKPFCKESVPNFYLTWRCVASKLAKHWTPLLAFFKILKLQVEDICSVEHPVEVASKLRNCFYSIRAVAEIIRDNKYDKYLWKIFITIDNKK